MSAQLMPRATRREFLKGAGSATLAALTIGFEWSGPAKARARDAAADAASGTAGGTVEGEGLAWWLRLGGAVLIGAESWVTRSVRSNWRPSLTPAM